MIHLTGVTKRYGKTLALDALTLGVPQGAIFGLLGPNGSGKSTLINLLMGFIFPDTGQIDRGEWLPARIGYVPERPFFPPRCPADEYLTIAGALSNLGGTALHDAVATRLHQVGLSDAARWRTNALSKGMLQRLALAQALLSNPSFLILDEPMNGLDPSGQKDVRALIKSLHDEGKTVLFSTHRLDDVADVCTHIGVLNRGRLMRAGALAGVLPLRAQVTITVDRLSAEMRNALAALHPDIACDDNVVTLNAEAVAHKADVLRRLLEAGADIRQLAHARASLEEIYLEAMR